MVCFKSKACLLLPIFLLISSLNFFFCHGTSQLQHFQTVPTQEMVDGQEYGALLSWATRRSVAEGTEGVPVDNSSLILAAERTHRKDPLNEYKRYTGGWNISDKHYWASVGFTAVPLFVIAVLWFVAFGLSLFLTCCCYCCCRRETYGYSRTAYALSLIFLILFTMAAIIGSVILYTGQGKFHGRTTDTLEYVVKQSNVTVDNLRNVSDYLAAAKRIGVDKVFLPSDIQTKIDQIQTKLNASAITLSNRTENNSEQIQDVLDTMRLFLIIVAAVMLLLAFLGFLFSILGLQFLVYILVIIGWILVAGTFILCGTFLLLHNVVADTCIAMDQWVEHPTAHTALDDILPCVDSATANETLLRTKEVTVQLVNVVNKVITTVSNVNFPPNLAPLYYNQSGPLVPILCNPFYSNMTNRKCASGEADLSNATQVWRSYVCQVSASGICTTLGRLTPDFYNQMTAAVNVSYGLYHYGPFLVQLEDCTFVRQTFMDISKGYCPGLRRYSKWIYYGLVLVSAAVMLSLIFWVVYARERRHRAYTKQFIVESGQGHLAESKDP